MRRGVCASGAGLPAHRRRAVQRRRGGARLRADGDPGEGRSLRGLGPLRRREGHARPAGAHRASRATTRWIRWCAPAAAGSPGWRAAPSAIPWTSSSGGRTASASTARPATATTGSRPRRWEPGHGAPEASGPRRAAHPGAAGRPHLRLIIAEGYGLMPSYGDQLPVRDRWAVVAYVRALQLTPARACWTACRPRSATPSWRHGCAEAGLEPGGGGS